MESPFYLFLFCGGHHQAEFQVIGLYLCRNHCRSSITTLFFPTLFYPRRVRGIPLDGGSWCAFSWVWTARNRSEYYTVFPAFCRRKWLCKWVPVLGIIYTGHRFHHCFDGVHPKQGCLTVVL